ncbi:MAG: HPr(Ser) kinase/phosphatase [Candidatus Cloacimonetes bacterium]|nr:HPr(Ser) kinase/phosphatase [Candidatus Cloacimonadota bacterium]
MVKLTVKQLFEMNKSRFVLSMVSNPNTFDKLITNQNINRPQLALSGYYHRFPYDRIQLLGETEIIYLNSLPDELMYNRLREIMMNNIPCFIVSKGLSVPNQMEFIANELNIAIMTSRLSTEKLFWQLTKFLREYFCQSVTMHSTFVEVHGVGILLTGKSGVGKSESALELIEKGHTLISDDVTLIKSNDETLIGMRSNLGDCIIEVRGVGFIDVAKMFGIQAVRKENKVDLQVELVHWQENKDFERLGLKDEKTAILGIKIPIISIPVSPGKNVSVIIEVIAMNQILKSYGIDASLSMQQRLAEEIQKNTELRNKK